MSSSPASSSKRWCPRARSRHPARGQLPADRPRGDALAVAFAKRPALHVITLGWATVGLGFAALTLWPALGGEMLYKPTSPAFAAERTPARHGRPLPKGLYSGASISGMVLSPPIGGFLYQYAPNLLWPLCCALALAAAAGLTLAARSPVWPRRSLGKGTPMDTPGRSVVAVLSEEHLKLQALSSELASASSTSDHVDVLTAWVSRHLSAEQRYLYPVVRELLPEGERLIEEELNQDQLILRRLAALRSSPPQTVPQIADELVADLRRHAYAAARDILPRLEEMTHDEDLISLGELMREAAASAPTRPHPRTPDRPPWNRMIDPLVGAVDRMRDRVSNRKTLLSEL